MGGLAFQRLDEIGPPPPRIEVIEGLLAAGERAFLVGEPGSGKSTVAAGIASAVSAGVPFLGRRTSCGGVFYIAAERSRSVQTRLFAAAAVSSRTFLMNGRPDLCKDFRRIIQAIKASECKPRLIILDTLARLMPDREENSAREMGVVVNSLVDIGDRFPSAAILALHHTSKLTGGARGSSALLGGIDLEIRLEKKKGTRSLVVGKANDVVDDQRLPFSIVPVDVNGASSIAISDAPAAGNADALRGQSSRNAIAAEQRAKRLYEALPTWPIPWQEASIIAEQIGILDGVEKAGYRTTINRLFKKIEALNMHAQSEVRGIRNG